MDDLLLHIENRICYLTLNRVHKHNAFDDALLLAMQNALDNAINNTEVKVIVLKANGHHFSAGADLQWMQKMAGYSESENKQDAMVLARLMNTLYSSPKPTIAMIHGSAYGGGVGLACACDIAIAATTASFCFSEIKLGLIPAVISPYVIAAIGPRHAKALFMSAEVLHAQQAKELGLIQYCIHEEELQSFTRDYAKRLASMPREGLKSCKTLVNKVAYQPIAQEVIEFTAEEIATRRVSSEGQQGLKAFLNKTTPIWE